VRVVIVGAGHGGGTVAALLRQQGFDGEVVLVGDEPVGPYHRPPLSKSLLTGELEQPLQPERFYADQGIDLRTGTTVTSIDRDRAAVTLGDGEELGYDALVLATGAIPRRLSLPGMDLAGVYELRTVAHAKVLADVLRPGSTLAIVGGGWIGLEVAASARAADVDVTVVEREEQLLARVASTMLSEFLTEAHRARGTTIVTSAQVTGIGGDENGAVAAVLLADGRSIPAARVLIGAGAAANDALARAAGLECADGIVVDHSARTSDPAVFAVGDATRRPVSNYEGLFRLESIPSAVEQARQAVAAILGADAPNPEVPWFWSEQFDLKLQMAGLLLDPEQATMRGDRGSDSFSVFHTRARRVIAVEAVNAPADFMAGKHLVRDGLEVDPGRLADLSVALQADGYGIGDEQDELSELLASPSEARATLEPAAPGHARITYVNLDGGEHVVEVAAGLTVMEGSVRSNLPGIIAECGGTCSCGTCHVYVQDGWLAKLDQPYPEETELLEFIDGRRPEFRLSCQLLVNEELNGLVVHVADYGV
jgi:3-phenylpropionate/trans-cinnamate dioxygenase ferredoxin reductase subunit